MSYDIIIPRHVLDRNPFDADLSTREGFEEVKKYEINKLVGSIVDQSNNANLYTLTSLAVGIISVTAALFGQYLLALGLGILAARNIFLDFNNTQKITQTMKEFLEHHSDDFRAIELKDIDLDNYFLMIPKLEYTERNFQEGVEEELDEEIPFSGKEDQIDNYRHTHLIGENDGHDYRPVDLGREPISRTGAVGGGYAQPTYRDAVRQRTNLVENQDY